MDKIDLEMEEKIGLALLNYGSDRFTILKHKADNGTITEHETEELARLIIDYYKGKIANYKNSVKK